MTRLANIAPRPTFAELLGRAQANALLRRRRCSVCARRWCETARWRGQACPFCGAETCGDREGLVRP